jgi:hypothetical protein
MGQKAKEKREALGDKYTGPHGHGRPAKSAARGAANKRRLEHLNERFRKADLPTQSTLAKAEAQRKQLAALLKQKEQEKNQPKKGKKERKVEAVEHDIVYDEPEEAPPRDRLEAALRKRDRR